MIRFRHELKYMITETQATAVAEFIRPFMIPDRHSATGLYPLVSLYLDTDNLALCKQSIDGIKNRFKLRIRSYSDDPKAICFFEIKRRINQIIVKSRARVPRDAVVPLLAYAECPSSVNSNDEKPLEQFLYYRRAVGAEPVIRVRYLRQAFESRCEDDVRVTFDRQLSLNVTRTPELGLNGYGWQRPRERGVVLEIKFTHGYPKWVNQAVRQFGLQQQSISKYAKMITHACAMRFCAPVIQPQQQYGMMPAPVVTQEGLNGVYCLTNKEDNDIGG